MSFYKGICTFLNGVLKTFWFLKVNGEQNIPSDGAFLLCSNHRSGLDPVILAASCSRQLSFMAKEELFKNPLFGAFLKKVGAFPIKRGKGDAAAVMATLKIMRSGGATLIFPEGTRMKRGERKCVNSGIIRLAIQTRVPIVPAYVSKHSVTYGSPIYFDKYEEFVKDTEKMQSLADGLMDTIYSFSENKPVVKEFGI